MPPRKKKSAASTPDNTADNLAAAFAGSDKRLNDLIVAAGYIHPDSGLRQKQLADFVDRKILLEWERDGLASHKVGNAKHYPLFDLIQFILNRSIKWRSTQSEELKGWAQKDMEYKARERQLKYEVEAGKYLEVDEVKRVWCDHINSARKRLLSIPRSIVGRIVGETSKRAIEKVIKDEIHSALEELSE